MTSANQAIFQFLLKVVDNSFGSTLKLFKSEHGYDGVGAFMCLTDLCLLRDPEQSHEARHKLDNLYINERQTLSSFDNIFSTLVEACKFSGKPLSRN